jgi:ABC-type uncharacterized transport system permease subunit
MKQFIKDLFNDDNSINEKAVVGFVAFLMLVIALIIDIITGWSGKELVINQFIFDGFMVITLGAFGIASVDKWINKTKDNNNGSSKEGSEGSEG